MSTEKALFTMETESLRVKHFIVIWSPWKLLLKQTREQGRLLTISQVTIKHGCKVESIKVGDFFLTGNCKYQLTKVIQYVKAFC